MSLNEEEAAIGPDPRRRPTESTWITGFRIQVSGFGFQEQDSGFRFRVGFKFEG